MPIMLDIITSHSFSFRLASLNEFGLIALWKKRHSPKTKYGDFSKPTGDYQVVTLYDIEGALLILSFGLFAAFFAFTVESCALLVSRKWKSVLIKLKKTGRHNIFIGNFKNKSTHY